MTFPLPIETQPVKRLAFLLLQIPLRTSVLRDRVFLRVLYAGAAIPEKTSLILCFPLGRNDMLRGVRYLFGYDPGCVSEVYGSGIAGSLQIASVDHRSLFDFIIPFRKSLQVASEVR